MSQEDVFPNFSSKNPRRLNLSWAKPGICKQEPPALCGASGGLWLTGCVSLLLAPLLWIVGRDSCGVLCSSQMLQGLTLVGSAFLGNITFINWRGMGLEIRKMFLSTTGTSRVTLHPPHSRRLFFEVQAPNILADLGLTVLGFLQMAPDLWWSVWLRIFFLALCWCESGTHPVKAIPRWDVLPVFEQCRAVTVSHGSACGSQLAELRDYSGKCSKKLLAHSNHMAAWDSVIKCLFSFGTHSLHMFNKCIPENNMFWVVPEKTRLRSQK